jgi:hypothetical protein
LEDLFYFSKQIVGLAEVKELAQSYHYECEERPNHMGVYVDGIYVSREHLPYATEDVCTPHQEFWTWQVTDWTNGIDIGLDPTNRSFLQEYAPRSGLTVSFHYATLPQLCKFLRDLLLKYGGIVGLDAEWVDDDGQTINVLTADTIMTFAEGLEK